MKGIRTLGMQLKLKRTEAGIHQETLGVILGGATQRLVHLWEVGCYRPSPRYLRQVNKFMALDPLALNVYIRATGL